MKCQSHGLAELATHPHQHLAVTDAGRSTSASRNTSLGAPYPC